MYLKSMKNHSESIESSSQALQKINEGYMTWTEDVKRLMRGESVKLEEIYDHLHSELQVLSNMLEMLNQQGGKRNRELIAQLSRLILTLEKKIDKVNLSSIFNGFQVINDRINKSLVDE